MTKAKFLIWSRALLLRTLVAAGTTLANVPMDARATGNWYVSNAGSGPWERINGSCVPQSDLRGGDFDGDGKTDVFNARGGAWFVSFGGNTKWKRINGSKVPIDQLRFGDFDGDGKTDVFNARGGAWFVSFGGNTKWKRINGSKVPIDQLRFGDFDADGKTDVFAKWEGKWRMSGGGSKGWQVINAVNPGVPDLGVRDLLSGNYIGDNRKDAFKSDTIGCGSSSSGDSPGPKKPDDSSSQCGGHREPPCSSGACKPGLTKVDNICYSCGVTGLACCGPQGGGFCFKGTCQPPPSTTFTCQ